MDILTDLLSYGESLKVSEYLAQSELRVIVTVQTFKVSKRYKEIATAILEKVID